MDDFVPPILKTKFAVSTANEHANSSFRTLDKVVSAISKMRNTISDLERIRALYIIHLRSYQADCEIMRTIYNDMKKKLNQVDQYQDFNPAINQNISQIQPMQQFSNHLESLVDRNQPMPPLTENIGLHMNMMNTTTPIGNTLSSALSLSHQPPGTNFVSTPQPQNQIKNLYVKQESIPNTSIQKIDLNWMILDPDTNQPYSPNMNPNKKGLLSKNNIMNIFTLETNSIIRTIKYDSTGTRFAYANGRFLFIGLTSTGTIEKYAELPRVAGRYEMISRVVVFSPDGQYIAVSSSQFDICIFNITGANCIFVKKLEGHTQPVSGAIFSSDSTRLISGGCDGYIFIWDMQQFTLIDRISHSPSTPTATQTPTTEESTNENNENKESNNNSNSAEKDASKDYSIASISMGCNDSFVAVGFMKGFVGIYEPSFKKAVTHFQAHDEILWGVATSKTEPLLLTASQDKTVKMWNVDSTNTTCLMTFSGHNDYVVSTCFSLDNQLVFTASKDEMIRGFSTANGQCLFVIQAHKNTVFEVDQHPLKKEFISCSSDGLICTWNYNTLT